MSSGYYVYGLIRADQDVEFGRIGLEYDGKPGRVFTLCVDSVAAVVSKFELPTPGDFPTRARVLPLLANMKPHHDVIREVMKTATIAPMTFGHVAVGEEEIKKELQQNRTRIEALLDRIEGSVEMGLQVKWAVDNIFAHFVEIDPELRGFRDEVFRSSQEPSYEGRFALGQMFVERLTEHRKEQTQRIEELFRSCCRELRVQETSSGQISEEIVADLAFLVDREGLGTFKERLHQVAADFPPEYVFDCSGPRAPFSFVDLDAGPAAASG